jgi:hypothetical protein
MKKSALMCDRHDEDVLALGTYEVRNGTGVRAVRLDLCTACVTEMTAFFTPVKRVAQASAKVEKPKHELSRRKSPGFWPDRDAKVLAAMKRMRANVHINDLIAATHLPNSTVGKCLRRLVEKEEIMETGGKGRYRRYHMPS